eukprot:CAMPEP_0201877000 /NCGR_PEP_ID=MMETSP0902-20130614/8522_1 /ASSEMBLY_ACC=CAM_ASM_000551 /TAXON_ID=420261 /ORGANISM="Thalassiosira antarctica, Strain CCMP982" /LENGTH=411 /DNA_ID=CAMNT_0048404355 /DNA_START=52 /DNA_END=1287 /DNA_ORIENTATION=-
MTNKRRAILAIATLSYTASAFQAPTTLHSATAASRQSTTTALFSSPEAEDARNAAKSLTNDAKNPKSQQPPLSTLVNRVAVAGATGRTGKYVVQQLLSQNVPVLAMVRDVDKAANVLDPTNALLTIRQTDLGSEKDVIAALSDGGEEGKCDAAIWAATGFSDSPDQSILDKLKAVFGLATNAQATIDAVGLPALGEGLAKTSKGGVLPKVVMLSSAGCTRPSWSEEKKLALDGSAGIPIVRLNPFGILDVKKESEEKLRSCGVEYCIFRPGGLNDSWSPNQRPIFSQGDVAVGRINRQDVAKILVDLLSTPEATGKTFEGVSIANSEGYYPPAPSIGPALDRLALDSVNGGTGPSEEVVRATYAIMQQLLPGEKQDAAKLAMGQTYEQLDKDEDGRLGKRGTEDAPIRSTS